MVIGIISSCTYDNREDEATKNEPCISSNISFSKDVKPILNSNCLSCHNKSLAEGGIVLEDFLNVKKVVESGRLLGAINHSPGFAPMPQGGAKLPDCEITKIRTWIKEGATDN